MAKARRETSPGASRPAPSTAARRRLSKEGNLWLATVRPNGGAHLVPVWFTYVAGELYVCTERRTVKVRNIEAHPNVAAALEGGDRPVIAFGRARLVPRPWPAEAVQAFRRKYDWDIGEEGAAVCLLAIEPSRWLEW